MARDLPLTVAAALSVPPLDQGTLVAGRNGLGREVRWVDIMHAPAEPFVRPGDLVLTTGADVNQPGVVDFLMYVAASAAAGLVISPPPDVAVDPLLVSLVPYADRHDCPVVLLPWEVAFSAVQRSLLPLVPLLPPDELVQMVIGRRDRDEPGWQAFGRAFATALQRLAAAAGATVEPSVTDDLIMCHFSPAQPPDTVTELVEAAKPADMIADAGVSWVLLPPVQQVDLSRCAPPPAPAAAGPVSPTQFAEVLRQHPQFIAIVLQTLQPLIDYDRTRRGQLVRTLEVLFNEAMNISAAARGLYLNRHSLLYRIGLIEDLTGLSLKNPEHRFQLEVSVRVHQITASGPR
ncbi:PucR family transcriptional regulator [uncultured Mycolicibacterium sp.]|uniref:PucR family transcriptional regulator n=1 Tax=uncultured Mycolicibacterium sp. TaxID=2320817 RepID=UPI0026193442|nr:PucR family transcriptional regulator [uncultured Mycolicibacterium sp.]